MYANGLLSNLTRIRRAKSGRVSSWDVTGRNNDAWNIPAGETKVLAELEGPGCINHIWMTQPNGYRSVLLQIYWDGEAHPSVSCPLGDFFGLGHEIVNSYDSLLFSASTARNNEFNQGCALNSYVQMPFNRSARIELVNQGSESHRQYFYIDYELYDHSLDDDVAYEPGYLQVYCEGASMRQLGLNESFDQLTVFFKNLSLGDGGADLDDVREQVREKLFQYIQNPADCVWDRLLTPKDLKDIFLFPGGNIDHTLLTGGQTYFDRNYSNQPATNFYRFGDLENVYMCGSGTYPCGSVTGTPGYMCSKELLRGLDGEEIGTSNLSTRLF